MKKLEMKDLTDAEKAEITLLLQKAQANADHQLSNAERNRIREEGRLKIVADRAAAAKVAAKLAREKAKERASRCCQRHSAGWTPSATSFAANADGQSSRPSAPYLNQPTHTMAENSSLPWCVQRPATPQDPALQTPTPGVAASISDHSQRDKICFKKMGMF